MVEIGEFDPDKFIDIVFHEGTASTLYGLPEDGKTNFAGVLMEMLTDRGYFTYTIVHFFDYNEIPIAIEKGKLPAGVRYRRKPDEVKVVDTVSELLIGLLSTEPNVCILDEGLLFAGSTLGSSKRVRLLKELVCLIRHFSSSFLLISQASSLVVPALREDLIKYEMRIKKMGVRKDSPRMLSIATGVRVIDEFSGEERVKFEVAEGDNYWGIPLTQYPIDSKYTPDFNIEDIDLVDARRRLRPYSSVKVRENNIGADVISQLKKESDTKENKQLNGEKMMTVSEYAEKMGKTTNTIRSWCDQNKIKFIRGPGGQRMIYADQ